MKTNNNDINWNKIARYLKIGIIGATIILIGDMLMGWGLKDETLVGIEGQLAQYLTISDTRMIIAAILGFSGVPIAVIGHYAIYKMLKAYTIKYARLYAFGILGFLAFGGAGVHVSSVEAAYFYKYMTAINNEVALTLSLKFVAYFLLPLYVILLIGWFIMVYAHIKAILKNLSPYPRWFFIFSMPVGSLIFSIFGLFGNHELINAIMVGAFSLGNIWSLGGHLCFLNQAKAKYTKDKITS